MPSDTPALLPPDPDRPGRYWLKTDHSPEPEVWTWDAKEKYWKQGGRWLSVSAMQLYHATLASPHPIPSAAALKRLHNPTKAMVDAVLSGLALDARIPDIIAAMLRAALEDKP